MWNFSIKLPGMHKASRPYCTGDNRPQWLQGSGYSLCIGSVKGAFDIGSMIRWLDYNDTWLAAEWGHPSDNLGGILAVADYLSRERIHRGLEPLKMHDVLESMIKSA